MMNAGMNDVRTTIKIFGTRLAFVIGGLSNITKLNNFVRIGRFIYASMTL